MHPSGALEDPITTEGCDVGLQTLEEPRRTIVSTSSVPDIPPDDPACCESSPLYSPLRQGSREIRVFDVAPADETDEFALCGRLRVVDLNDNPKFTALSYVWGTCAIPPHRVSCGSSSLKVTTNCHSALHQLRKSFNPLTIWVDSICINQEDEEEQATQIPLMGDIYSMAESVYIWLGEGSPDSDVAIDYLSNAGFQKFLIPYGKFNYLIPEKSAVLWGVAIFHAYVRHIQGFKAYVRIKGQKGLFKAIFFTTLALTGQLVVPHEVQAPYTAVANFLLNDWNERIWTLQEVLLATNPIVFCGTKSVTWRCFMHSIAYLEQASEWHLFFMLKERENTCNKWSSIVSLWLTMNSELQAWKQDEESSSRCAGKLSISASNGVQRDLEGYFGFLKGVRLLTVILPLIALPKYFRQGADIRHNIIDEILMRKTTDPRDKSHGMRAVLSKLGLDFPAPDLFASKNIVFRDLFIGLTKWTGSLRPLLFAYGQMDGDNPSWVPAFDSVSNMWLKEYLCHRRTFHIEILRFGFRERILGISSSGAQFSFTNDNKMLVRGYTIGEVNWKGDKFLKSVCDNTDTAIDLQNIRAVCEPWFLYKRKAGFLFTALNQPLLRDLHALCVDKNMAAETAERGISDWWSKINQWKGPSSTAEDFLKKLSTRPSRLELHLRLCNNLASKKRCFFHTLSLPEQMIMFGNGPEALELGDKIVAIESVPVPLVIRRELERESFRLIGFAEFGLSPWGRSIGNHFKLRGRQWEKIVLR